MKNIPRSMTAEEIRDLVGTPPLFLEIGSHDGSHTVKFLAAMPDVELHCFEPDQRPITRFKEAIGHDSRVTLVEKMVADVDGEKLFYPSGGKSGHMEDWDYSGSPSKPTGHFKRSPEIIFKSAVMLPSIRLDTWFESIGGGVIDFAWVDLQGSQRTFIAGGEQALAFMRYLYIECHHPVPLYEDEPSRKELIALLPGFEPVAFYDCDNILFKHRHFQ